MQFLWIIDPTTGQKSVSLTILTATFVLVVVSGGLEMFELIKNTSLFGELYYGALALYFSRRFSFNGKSFSSEKAEQIKEQLEKGK